MKKLELQYQDRRFKTLNLDNERIGKGIFAFNIQVRSIEPRFVIQILTENGLKEHIIDAKDLNMSIFIENKKESN